VFNFLEWRWPLALRRILEQLSCPGGVLVTRASPDDASYEVAMQQKIIGTGCELDQAVSHMEFLSEAS